ncbi:MAG: hypothetical protein IH927_01350 [Proteobacteria bacterium]|nr:hypothetical protein [Pseudomonadota bacterium]
MSTVSFLESTFARAFATSGFVAAPTHPKASLDSRKVTPRIKPLATDLENRASDRNQTTHDDY